MPEVYRAHTTGTYTAPPSRKGKSETVTAYGDSEAQARARLTMKLKQRRMTHSGIATGRAE